MNNMAITENGFETAELNRYELLALEQRESVAHDSDATAEQWAHNIIEAIDDVDPASRSAVHVAYFMLEDSFHRDTHGHFIQKLGIQNVTPGNAEPQQVYGGDGIALWREVQLYEPSDPQTCFGVRYWATPEADVQRW